MFGEKKKGEEKRREEKKRKIQQCYDIKSNLHSWQNFPNCYFCHVKNEFLCRGRFFIFYQLERSKFLFSSKFHRQIVEKISLKIAQVETEM